MVYNELLIYNSMGASAFPLYFIIIIIISSSSSSFIIIIIIIIIIILEHVSLHW